MAIFSLHHTPIGKSTQARPHTAAAHVGYITRRDALTRLDGARFPQLSGQGVAAYLRQMEDGDRRNARVADKIMLALPRELNAAQRAALVRAYAEELTQGRASWLAAFHEWGKDAANPHCHLVIRDRDPATGRRVIGMSEAGSTGLVRALWEQHANRALEQAGCLERIDRRTLAEQGIARVPTIHEGPKAQAMDARGARPDSRTRTRRNGRGARSPVRMVDYPQIDRGRTRPGFNRGLASSAKSGRPLTPAEAWAALDRDRQEREFAELGYAADWRRNEERQGASVERLARLLAELNKGIRPVVVAHAGLEAGAPGLNRGPAVLEPAPDGIGAGKAQDSRANALGPRAKPARHADFKEVQQPALHANSMRNKNLDFKGSDVKDWEREHLEREARASRNQLNMLEGHIGTTMNKAYLEPEKAAARMDAYRARHGEQAFMEKLREDAGYFGRRRGSIASLDGYKSGAGGRQADSTVAREQLTGLFADKARLQGQYDAATRALGPSRTEAAPSLQSGAAPSQDMPRRPSGVDGELFVTRTGADRDRHALNPVVIPAGKDVAEPSREASEAARRLSFSEQLERKAAERAADPARQEQEKQAQLERLQREREEDKERGR